MPGKKLVGAHRLENGGIIEIYEVDFSNLQELFPYKPANSPMSDGEWAHFASFFGVAHAWNSCFWEWLKAKGYKWGPGEMLSVCFGQIGDYAYKVSGIAPSGGKPIEIADGQWKAATDALIESEWPLEQLGPFGVWLKEANIDPVYARSIIKEFMED